MSAQPPKALKDPAEIEADIAEWIKGGCLHEWSFFGSSIANRLIASNPDGSEKFSITIVAKRVAP